MALELGTRFGPYEITERIGAGGMGEVYRAHDTNLERDVAIKILPESFASDAGRVARFDQEAKTLASLNHANVAQVYGLERVEGKTAIVMELVEGPTLADRIARGPMPADEATGTAHQIADALEAAHEQNIIHRDLKPANVKLKPDGTVKVLDFGIAKALVPELRTSSGSPIVTTPVTQVGVILGTAAYMSPEQAQGKRVDKRTDIWAFGCVLYEMLTGQLAFGGEDVAVILARVIADDPDLKPLPATISPAVQRTVELCLQKDPRKRLRDIGDVKLALAGAFETGGGTGAAFAALAARPPAWRRMLVPMAMLVAGALLAGAAAWTLRPAPEARPVNRFTFTFSIPADQQLRAGEIFALAPDGRQFVYKTQRGLYLRRLDELEPRLIPGTAEGGAPLFSPNSQHILYATDRSTWEQIATSGGASVFIGPRQGLALGASWSEDGTIYFAQPAGIFRVPAAGGGAELLIAPENAENFHGPALLPDGDSLLFSIADGAAWDAARIVVQSLATGERTELLSGGSDARYVSTGHIVYAYGDTLFAVAFDLDTLTVSGGAVPLVRGVMRAGQAGAGGANYGIANNGTLAYVAATPAGGRRTLTWVDRDGREEPIAIEPSTYMYPRISPDGRRVVLDDRNSNDDVWIWDFRGQTRTRITIGGSGGQYPAWTNDGARLARADTGGAIVVVAANNTGTAQTLVPAGTLLAGRPSPYFFTPDDRALVFRDQNHPETADNILMVGADGGGTPTPLLAASYNERNAELSPDARFMAYQSDESGRWEVYVRPFPNVDDDRVPVSNAGGIEPLWSRDGRELFYLAGEAGSLRLMAVAVDASDTRFAFGERRTVLEWPYSLGFAGRSYDVSPDGQRFLAIKEGGSDTETQIDIIIVENWTEELKRLVPTQ